VTGRLSGGGRIGQHGARHLRGLAPKVRHGKRLPVRQARRDPQERDLKGASKSMMSMTEKELEKMAHTERKGKPEHAKT
jgi:Protein of unknwon function (DUF3008)